MSQFFDPTGYNKADAEFREHDEQLLKELRDKLSARRSEVVQANTKKAHWMKCPKCGGDMQELNLTDMQLSTKSHAQILIDQCKTCGGVYFDAGELALLIGRDPQAKGLVKKLFSWLPRYDEAVALLWGKQK